MSDERKDGGEATRDADIGLESPNHRPKALTELIERDYQRIHCCDAAEKLRASEEARRRAEEKAARIEHGASRLRCPEHAQDASFAWGCPECVRTFREENAALRAQVERLRAALVDVQQDIDVCNWRCVICGTDPEMKETDLAAMVRKALADAPEAKE